MSAPGQPFPKRMAFLKVILSRRAIRSLVQHLGQHSQSPGYGILQRVHMSLISLGVPHLVVVAGIVGIIFCLRFLVPLG